MIQSIGEIHGNFFGRLRAKRGHRAETQLILVGGTMQMTLGVRHYFGTYQSESFAVRHSVCRVAAATSASFLFAWLLGAIVAEPHYDRDAPVIRGPLTTNSYKLFLDSRFDVYFSREIFSKTFSL